MMKINNYIEHTILKPDCTNKDIEKYILKIIEVSNKFNITKEEVLDIFEYLYGSDE